MEWSLDRKACHTATEDGNEHHVNSYDSLPLLLFLIKAVIVLIIPLFSLEPRATLVLYLNRGLSASGRGKERRDQEGG